MQTITDGPRSDFTVDEVTYLIAAAPSVKIGFGVELINLDLSVEKDISADVSACTVSRNNLDELHGSATFAMSQPLDWGNSIVHPYYTMTGPVSSTATTLTTVRFYLGAFFVDTPQENLAESPPTFDATGYDILSILDDPIGEAYSVDTGVSPLERIEEILLGRGVTQYQIDQDRAGATVASPMVWTLDDDATWLLVVNALLKQVGYQGIWTDWNGVFRCGTYTTPADRSSEWTFGADVATTLLTQRRTRQRDFYNAPNRWVFYRSGSTDDAAPTAGAGLYEYVNQSVGETSVEARGGRTITKVESIDAADQTALVAAAQQTIDKDSSIPTRFVIETAPFPLAYHMDLYTVSDPDLGVAQKVLASSWSLDLGGADMSHEWSSIE